MHPDDTSAQKATPPQPTTRSADEGSPERTNARHRAPSRGVRALLTSPPARVTLAAGLAGCLGVATYAGTRAAAPEPPNTQAAEAAAERVDAADRASRAHQRQAASPTPASPSPTVSASPTASASPSATEESTASEPVPPQPVAGLTQTQMDNAKVIVDVGTRMDIPRRGLIVAIATAMQESTLLNYANGGVPESRNYPHQAVGWDHDSVGLFQQRPSSGWGNVAQLMRPTYAAEAFYQALLTIPGWQEMSVAWAAQSVQVSAFPDAYAQHVTRATTVVTALV